MHSHKKRNSLDTWAIFIEFLKYVENSGVVVYQGDRSFKMASKSEDLLAGDDIEEILAVVDSNILAKPNDLESEFAATVSKIQDINSESCFLCQNCRKAYKTKRRLNRHQSAEHGDYKKTYEVRLPLDTFEQFVAISKVKLANDQCFESFVGEYLTFLIDKECIKNVRG